MYHALGFNNSVLFAKMPVLLKSIDPEIQCEIVYH